MQTQNLLDKREHGQSQTLEFITKGFLTLNLAVYAGFTLVFLLFPISFANWIGISIQSSAALADFRAMYSGLCLGIAIPLYYGITRIEFRVPALYLAIATAGGLFLGRFYTLLLDGPGNEYIYLSMATEVFSVFFGAWLVRRS